MEGVQSHTSNATGPRRNIRIKEISSNLQRVIAISQLMTKEVKSDFVKRYGRILDLLTISIQAPVLRALTQFWNSSLRCFELPNFDIVPTIEEYTTMVRLPIKESAGVYLYKGQYVEEAKIAKLIGMQSQIRLETKGSIRGLSRTVLEAHLRTLAEQGNWEYFNKTLAVIIYGLVLFPFTLDTIDHAAIDVFYQYEQHGANPIPAILSDTFLSIEICHQKKGGTLRCCLHMLYVWIVTHMYARNHMGLIPDPLKDFSRIPMRSQEAKEWKEEFIKVETNRFRWACPWYHPINAIFSCGNFPNVPLMGPRGCVAYTPTVALRQLKWTQVEPRDEALGGLIFQYGENVTNKQLAEVRAAWGNIRKKGEKEFGTTCMKASPEYEKWRMARGVPGRVTEKRPCDKDLSQVAARTLADMVSQVESLKTQKRDLEEKKEHTDVEVVKLQSQCRKMSTEIERWKEAAYKNTSHAKRARKGKEKESEAVMYEAKKMKDMIEAQKETIDKILKEKKPLEIKNNILEQHLEMSQRELSEANLYADRGWASAKRYHDSLMIANKNEAWLRKKNEELSSEIEWWKSEAQRQQQEKEDWVRGWQAEAEYQETMKRVWIQKHEDLLDNIQYHVVQWTKHFDEANDELCMDPWLRLPPKMAEFMKHCRGLAKSFRKKKVKLLL